MTQEPFCLLQAVATAFRGIALPHIAGHAIKTSALIAVWKPPP